MTEPFDPLGALQMRLGRPNIPAAERRRLLSLPGLRRIFHADCQRGGGMTPEQLEALINFIRAAAWRAADEQSGQVSPSSDRREEAALRAAFASNSGGGGKAAMISGHDIQDLIGHWQQEARLARESQRTDDYAELCMQTVDGLRELSKWRRLEVLQEWIEKSE